jgi:hypothetical protein
MLPKARILLVVLLACGSLIVAAAAWAADSLMIEVHFTPDKLGVPTNISATAKFSSTTEAPPSPLNKVTIYLPAGMELDSRGAGICTAAKLEAVGPDGCPADSRVGFGGGMGIIELAKEIIREPFTFDLFFAPKEDGRVVILAYVVGSTPVSFEIVVVAREIQAPKPYGLGFSVDVPPIPTLPDASNASVESAFITAGATNVAYYRTVHGKRTLFHVRGLVIPRTCPRGGFPFQATIDFADGTALTADPSVPCPSR